MAFIIDGSTGIATVDGSVAAPSQRGQDSNSGISYAADTIKFSTGGVERMAITNSGVSGIATGITMIDTYVLTSSMSMSGASWNYLKSNFSRVNGAFGTMNVTGLGTGLNVDNSGSASTFTFPSTGYYQIEFTSTTAANTSSSHDYVYAVIAVAKDGSTFDETVPTINFIYSSSATIYNTQFTKVVLDVTNTSNDKFYLAVQPENSSLLLGGSDKLYTYLQVKKLAET